MMNGSQNGLQPDSEVLVKFFILGGVSFSVLFEDGWENFLGHILFPRVNVVNPPSLCLLHVQKGVDGLLSVDDFYPQNI